MKEELAAGNTMEQEICVICQNEYTRDVTEKTRTMRCNHEFHVNCLEPWLDDKQSCPVCRRQIACVICKLDFIRDNTETIRASNCQHEFHVRCVEIEHQYNFKCPKCKDQTHRDENPPRSTTVTRYRPPNGGKDFVKFLLVVFLLVTPQFGNDLYRNDVGRFQWKHLLIMSENIYREAIDWGSSLFLPKKCTEIDILKQYRGVVLDQDFVQDFMRTGEITINVNSKKMENTVDRQDLDKIVLFHVALINKQSVDVYMHSMESGIFVIAKYCEQNQLCVTVKVNTKGLLLQNMISVPFKTVLEINITFKLNKENFLVTFSPRNSKNSTIARLPAINLNGYTLVAGLGHPNFARTTLAFGNLTISCRVHKKIHLSTDGHAISNYQGVEKSVG